MKKILIYTGLLLVTACGPKEKEAPAEQETSETGVTLTAAQQANAGIQTGLPGWKEVRQVLKVNGAIDVPPQSLVSVSFPLGGYVKSTRLLPGMHVSKGEVLGVMEDVQYIQLQQDYLVAKARLTYLEQELKRQQELNAAQAGSDKVLQQTQSDFLAQKVTTRALAEKLRLIGLNPASLSENNISRTVNILSPVNGFVSSVKVNTGRYVTPTEVLFELVDPNDIHLNLNVYEKDVPYLRIGQEVQAYSNNTATRYPARIILISRNLDESRSAEVHCHFLQYDKSLLPGMYMNAEVHLDSRWSLVVPEEAVVNWNNKAYVFEALDSSHFEMREVKAAPAESGMVAIGVDDTEAWKKKRLVIKNAYAILMKIMNKAEEE